MTSPISNNNFGNSNILYSSSYSDAFQQGIIEASKSFDSIRAIDLISSLPPDNKEECIKKALLKLVIEFCLEKRKNKTHEIDFYRTIFCKLSNYYAFYYEAINEIFGKYVKGSKEFSQTLGPLLKFIDLCQGESDRCNSFKISPGYVKDVDGKPLVLSLIEKWGHHEGLSTLFEKSPSTVFISTDRDGKGIIHYLTQYYNQYQGDKSVIIQNIDKALDCLLKIPEQQRSTFEPQITWPKNLNEEVNSLILTLVQIRELPCGIIEKARRLSDHLEPVPVDDFLSRSFGPIAAAASPSYASAATTSSAAAAAASSSSFYASAATTSSSAASAVSKIPDFIEEAKSVGVPQQFVQLALTTRVDGKYLLDGVTENSHKSTKSRGGRVPDPVLTFKRLGDIHIGSSVTTSFSNEITTQDFTGRHLSLSDSPIQPSERVTFVFVGRKADSLIPEETDGGRVILVVPKTDESIAKTWLGEKRDVLIVDSLLNSDLEEKDLGLITVRRIAALSFAQNKHLQNIIMIDDNIEHFISIENSSSKNWRDIYDVLKTTAEKEPKMTCLSVNTFLPNDANREDKAEPDVVANHLGSKIFFIDVSKLQQTNISPRLMLPHDVKIWGEDLFFQYALLSAGLGVGTIGRKQLLIRRSVKNTHTCANTVQAANNWLLPTSKPSDLETLPDCIKKAYSLIRLQVIKNVENNDANRQLDMGQETSRQAARAGDNESGDNSPSERKPKKKQEKKDTKKSPSKPLSFNMPVQSPADIQATTTKVTAFAQALRTLLSNENISQILREHQKRAISALATKLDAQLTAREPHLGYFSMVPGAGKTRIFLLLALSAISNSFNQKNVLIVVPNSELADQTYQSLQKLTNNPIIRSIFPQFNMGKVIRLDQNNINAQNLSRNQDVLSGGKIVIGVEDSVKLLLKEENSAPATFGLVLVDELHEIWDDILNYFQKFSEQKRGVVLGFSGTPGQKRKKYFGSRIFRYNFEQARRDEILCDWHIQRLPYSKKKTEAFYENLAQLLKETTLEGGTDKLADSKGIIFVNSIIETESVCKKLKTAGIKADYIHSGYKNSAEINRQVIARFKKVDSSVNVIVAVNMLRLGFDAAVDYIVFGRNISKKHDWKQRMARALRLSTFRQKSAGQKKVAHFLVFDDALVPESFQPRSSTSSSAGGLGALKRERSEKPENLDLSNEPAASSGLGGTDLKRPKKKEDSPNPNGSAASSFMPSPMYNIEELMDNNPNPGYLGSLPPDFLLTDPFQPHQLSMDLDFLEEETQTPFITP